MIPQRVPTRICRRRQAWPSARRGSAAIATLLILGVIISVVGMTLELALIHEVKLQLQGASDASVLAATAELVDEDLLVPGHPGDQHDDVGRARRKAVAFAHSNVAAGVPVKCRPNWQNDPRGDVVIGHLEPGRRGGWRFCRGEGKDGYDAVRVTLHRTRECGNPVSLWFTPFVGLTRANVSAVSIARIDRHVIGFSPTREVNIPMVPIVILHKGRGSWERQTRTAAVLGVNDRFRIDPRCDEVRPGGDGIPEVELRFPRGAGEPNAGFLTFACGVKPPTKLVDQQIKRGLRAVDLAEHGGKLKLDGGSLWTFGQDEIGSKTLASLQAITGKNRIWPLYGLKRDVQGCEAFQLNGFAAGRVVDTWVESDHTIVVLVQPDQLITPTAILAHGASSKLLNPWIGKLALVK